MLFREEEKFRFSRGQGTEYHSAVLKGKKIMTQVVKHDGWFGEHQLAFLFTLSDNRQQESTHSNQEIKKQHI